MGTPVRRLLFPKILSPLTRSPKQNSPSLNNQTRACFSKQYLNVENAVRKNNTNGFHIKVTDYGNKLLINTPNKQQLMTFGVSSIANVDVLGKGTFGTVISGMYKDCRVAAKIVKLREQNLREKNALNLKHKNLVKIIDVVHNVNCCYGIVLMEYLNLSRHLQSIIDDSSIDLTLAKIVKYALDICEGLKYCHDNNVLHLDVKPNNVLLCENHICKLCDFGSSLSLDECTRSNVHVGTVIYSAPELLSGKVPTVKCDVYSLGIVMWQMRYRMMPYSNLDGVEVVIYKVVKYNHRPSTSNEEQDEYNSIFSSCWSAEPKDRPEILNVISKLKTIP